jgi:hypothetical protein
MFRLVHCCGLACALGLVSPCAMELGAGWMRKRARVCVCGGGGVRVTGLAGLSVHGIDPGTWHSL